MRYVSVVKVLKGVHSAFDHGTYTLEYVQGRWTYPRIGKIYAFQDYEHAKRWASDYEWVTLWEAEAEVAKNGTCMVCSEENKYLWIFWKWYSLFLTGKARVQPEHLPTAFSPNGTVLCNKLRITKQYTTRS